MADSALIHPRTAQAVADFASKPGQALLVLGTMGRGKGYIARQIAAMVLEIDPDKLDKYAYFTVITKPKDKSEIGVEAAREINRQLKLKSTSPKAVNRLILIEDAQYLSEEAQNALLKILEEPPAGSLFILTADSINNLLPTVVSRLRQLEVLPISQPTALEALGQNESVTRAWRLSQGNVGLLLALLETDVDHPLKLAIEQARGFLKADPYGRLTEFEALSRSRDQLSALLEAMGKLLAALQHSQQLNKSQHQRLITARKLVEDLAEAVSLNASTKLAFIHLSLNLKV